MIYNILKNNLCNINIYYKRYTITLHCCKLFPIYYLMLVWILYSDLIFYRDYKCVKGIIYLENCERIKNSVHIILNRVNILKSRENVRMNDRCARTRIRPRIVEQVMCVLHIYNVL